LARAKLREWRVTPHAMMGGGLLDAARGPFAAPMVFHQMVYPWNEMCSEAACA
jgi:hypothetical protein